jgi:Na+-driven multidrug efflux pump
VALLVAFYGLTMPLGIFLAFYVGLAVIGLWYAMLTGLLVLNLLFIYLVWYHYDWKEIIVESLVRSKMENEALERLEGDPVQVELI